jgi:hypothetical protein
MRHTLTLGRNDIRVLLVLVCCMGWSCKEDGGGCEDTFALPPDCSECISSKYFFDPLDERCELSVQDFDVEGSLNTNLFMGARRTELIDQ